MNNKIKLSPSYMMVDMELLEAYIKHGFKRINAYVMSDLIIYKDPSIKFGFPYNAIAICSKYTTKVLLMVNKSIIKNTSMLDEQLPKCNVLNLLSGLFSDIEKDSYVIYYELLQKYGYRLLNRNTEYMVKSRNKLDRLENHLKLLGGTRKTVSIKELIDFIHNDE